MLDRFREIWFWDFEFGAEDGERQVPVCMVAIELRSGRKIRLWRDEFPATPTFNLGPGSLFVAYLASAEIRCHQALGWCAPKYVLDLYVEFRWLTNGRRTEEKPTYRLIDALVYFGVDA